MNIGIPKERRSYEFRVGLTPTGVQMLTRQGHICYVEHDAGVGAGFSDQDYLQAGARLAYQPHEVFGRADLLLKVARPIYDELEWMRPEITFAGLLHLGSARKDKLDIMTEKKITAIAYEQIVLPDGTFPVRKPLSQLGGRMAAQIGATLMQNDFGGKGVMLGGGPGVPPAEVVVIGAGIAGTEAVKAFIGMGSHVTVMDIDMNALERIYNQYPCLVTMVAYDNTIARVCRYADIVLGTVLVPGQRPPVVVTREMVQSMKPRSLIMDISIDEGGCIETARPTTHEHPTYLEEGVIHYCVPNISSVVARTSTYAYLNAAFPFILEIAGKGPDKAIAENTAIRSAARVFKGEVLQSDDSTPEG